MVCVQVAFSLRVAPPPFDSQRGVPLFFFVSGHSATQAQDTKTELDAINLKLDAMAKTNAAHEVEAAALVKLVASLGTQLATVFNIFIFYVHFWRLWPEPTGLFLGVVHI